MRSLGIAARRAVGRDRPSHGRRLPGRTSSSSAAACRSAPMTSSRMRSTLSAGLDLWRVAVQPGKPLAFGRAKRDGREGEVLLFGLPGNPVSSFVTFELFVRPVLRRLAGHATSSAAISSAPSCASRSTSPRAGVLSFECVSRQRRGRLDCRARRWPGIARAVRPGRGERPGDRVRGRRFASGRVAIVDVMRI